MKTATLYLLSLPLLTLFGGHAMADQLKPNDLVGFLAGKWENVSFEIADGKEIKREVYPETMVVKDIDTLTITAHAYRDGHDLVKDMHLILHGDDVTMQQGDFKATGKREGNVYSMRGSAGGTEYRFRLYAMGDRYVFHRETWRGSKIEQMDMSYLVRKP